MSGKGDNPRPRYVSLSEWEDNYALAMSKTEKKEVPMPVGAYGESKDKESIIGKKENRK